MAHNVTIDKEARIVEQCARGRFNRLTWQKPISWNLERTASAGYVVSDIIDGEQMYLGMGIAPCDGKVVRIFANASVWPQTQLADGTGAPTGVATIQCYKAGASDVSLNTALDIDGNSTAVVKTAETAVDAVLSTTTNALNLTEGQLVYALLTASATTTANASNLVLEIEFVPTDASYAGS